MPWLILSPAMKYAVSSRLGRKSREPGLFVVPDLPKDCQFVDNPLVTAAEGLRFYAGALLEYPGGLLLGTVCVLDTSLALLAWHSDKTGCLPHWLGMSCQSWSIAVP